MSDTKSTPPDAPKFDREPLPENLLIHDRRSVQNRRQDSQENPPKKVERRSRTERRRRIDPTTFEKQYTEDELEFMNAMQQYKVESGKSFPTHEEVLRVAHTLGYRKVRY